MLSGYELYGAKLSLRQKFARLTDRMRDREWRQFFGTIAAAKLLGVVLVAFFMGAVPAHGGCSPREQGFSADDPRTRQESAPYPQQRSLRQPQPFRLPVGDVPGPFRCEQEPGH